MRPASGTASCARTLHRTVGEKDMLVVLSHWVGRDGVTITCSVSSCFGQACLVLHLELARDTAVHERMGRKPLLHSAPAQNSLPASVRLHPLPRVGCGKNGTGPGRRAGTQADSTLPFAFLLSLKIPSKRCCFSPPQLKNSQTI